MALRDFDKVQERMMLRIEVRHIVQLVLLFLVGSSGAFYAGYRFGHTAGRAECPQPMLAPVVAVAPAAALPAAVTRAADPAPVVPAAVVAADAAAADPDALAAAPDPDAIAAPSSADAAAPLDTPEPADTGETKAPAATPDADARLVPDGSTLAAANAADATKPDPASKPDPAAKPAPAAASKAKEDDSAREADDKPAIERQKAAVAVQGKPAGPRPIKPAPPVEAPIAPKVKYVIQIKAFRNEQEATAFAKSLQDKGHPVVLTTIDVPGKGQFWRVRLGPFDTLDDARAAQRKFEAAEGHTTMILASQ